MNHLGNIYIYIYIYIYIFDFIFMCHTWSCTTHGEHGVFLGAAAREKI